MGRGRGFNCLQSNNVFFSFIDMLQHYNANPELRLKEREELEEQPDGWDDGKQQAAAAAAKKGKKGKKRQRLQAKGQ